MTEIGFWIDDAQVVDERIVRTYAEKGSITIQVETLKQPGRFKA
jgi:Holliday junction resolvase RusA-like endonuclease